MSGSEYVPAEFFVLRHPLLPFTRRLELVAHPEAPASPIGEWRTNCPILQHVLAEPALLDALTFSAPHFVERLNQSKGIELDPRELRKIERMAFRTLIRATSNPVPRGGFAGWAVGEFSDRSRCELQGPSEYKTIARLEYPELTELCFPVRPGPVRRCLFLLR